MRPLQFGHSPTFIGALQAARARTNLAGIPRRHRACASRRMAGLLRFLERADMIKFARVDATTEDSQQLLSSASAFVEGGGA